MLRDYCTIILFPTISVVLDKSYFAGKPNILPKKNCCKVAIKIFKCNRGLTQILLQSVCEVNHTRSQVMTNRPWEKDWVPPPGKNSSTSGKNRINSFGQNLKHLMLLMTSSTLKTPKT